MVVMGELCVYLHLYHNLRTAHNYVLVSINCDRAQVEIYQAKTSTEYTDQYEKKVRYSNQLLPCPFISNFIYQVAFYTIVMHFISLND